SNLSASSANGTVTLTWSDIAGESGYHLQWTDNTRSGANNDQIIWNTVNLAANTTSWSSSSLPSNMPLYFRVMGYNASNVDAPVSNIASATNFPAVNGLAAQGLGGAQVRLTWTDNILGETSFEIQKSTDGSTWTAGTTASG